MSEKPSLLMSAGHALTPQCSAGLVPTRLSTLLVKPSQSGSLPDTGHGGSSCVGLYQSGQLSEPLHQELVQPGSQVPSRSLSTCTWAQPLASTLAPGAVPGHRSEPVHHRGLLLPASQMPSASASTCTWAQPLVSTVAPGAVPGHWSRGSGTPSPSVSAGGSG